jgi:hypothetical protein
MDYVDFTVLLSSPVEHRDVLEFSLQVPFAASAAPITEAIPVRLDLRAILVLISGPPRRPLSTDAVLVSGRALGDALFPGVAIARFREVLAFQRARGDGLRIRILGNEAFQRIPWEYTVLPPEHGEPTTTDILALRPDISIVREPDGLAPAFRPAATSWPITILATAAHPAGRDPIDVDRERDQLAATLRSSTSLALNWTASGTRPDTARDRAARIFHFAGHGGLVGSGAPGDRAPDHEDGGPARDIELDDLVQPLDGRGVVVFDDGRGGDDVVDGGTLGVILRELGVTTAVINACRSGQREQRRAWSSVAAGLLTGGIDSVIAMQHEVLDASAIAFSAAFYLEVAAQRSLDEAVHRGRLAVFERGDRLGWGTPVLYMRGAEATRPTSDVDLVGWTGRLAAVSWSSNEKAIAATTPTRRCFRWRKTEHWTLCADTELAVSPLATVDSATPWIDARGERLVVCDGNITRELGIAELPIVSLIVTDDIAFCIDRGPSLYAFDRSSGRLRLRQALPRSAFTVAAISSAQDVIALGASDGMIALWGPNRRLVTARVRGNLVGLAFADDRTLVGTLSTGRIMVLDVGRRSLATLADIELPGVAAADGLTASGEGTIALLSTTGIIMFRIAASREAIQADSIRTFDMANVVTAALSPTGRYVAIATPARLSVRTVPR